MEHGFLCSGAAAHGAGACRQHGHGTGFPHGGCAAEHGCGKSWFNDVSFVGDSLTQGMQLYEEGMQNAMFCAYKGVGPNVIVNGTICKRADGRPRCRWKP